MGSLGANVRNSKKIYEQFNSFAGGMNTTEENISLSDTESRNIENLLLTERGTLNKRLGSVVEYDVGRTLKETYRWMMGTYQYLNAPNEDAIPSNYGIFSAGYDQEYASFLANNKVIGHFTRENGGNTEHYLALMTGIYDTKGNRLSVYNYNYASDNTPVMDVTGSVRHQWIEDKNFPVNVRTSLKWDWVLKVSEEGYYCYNCIPYLSPSGKIAYVDERYIADPEGDPANDTFVNPNDYLTKWDDYLALPIKKYYVGQLGRLTEGDSVDPDNEAWWPVNSDGEIVSRAMPTQGRWYRDDGKDPQKVRDLTHQNFKTIIYATKDNPNDVKPYPDDTHTVITPYTWSEATADNYKWKQTTATVTYDADGKATAVAYTQGSQGTYAPDFWEIIENSRTAPKSQEIETSDWASLTEDEIIARRQAALYLSYFRLAGNVYRDDYALLVPEEERSLLNPFWFARNLVMEDLWFNNQWGLNYDTSKKSSDPFTSVPPNENFEINSQQEGTIVHLLMNGKKYKFDTGTSIKEVIPYKPTFTEYNNLKGNLLGLSNTALRVYHNKKVPGAEYDQYYNWDWTQNPNLETDKKIPMLLGLMAQGIPVTGQYMNFRAVHSTPDTQIDGVNQYTWKFSWTYVMDTGDTSTPQSTVFLTNIPSPKTDLVGFKVPGVDTGNIRLTGNLETNNGSPLGFKGLSYLPEDSHFIALRASKHTSFNFNFGLPPYTSNWNNEVHDYFEYYNDVTAQLDGTTFKVDFDDFGITSGVLMERGTNGYSAAKGSGPTGFMYDMAFSFQPVDLQKMVYARQMEITNNPQSSIKNLQFTFTPTYLKVHLNYNEFTLGTSQPHYFVGAKAYLSFAESDLLAGEPLGKNDPRGAIADYDITPVHSLITDQTIPDGANVQFPDYHGTHHFREISGTYKDSKIGNLEHLGLTSEESYYGLKQDLIPEDERFSLRHHSDKLMGATANSYQHIHDNWFANGAVNNIIAKFFTSPLPSAAGHAPIHDVYWAVKKGGNKTDLDDQIEAMSEALAKIDFAPDITEMWEFLSGDKAPVETEGTTPIHSPIAYPVDMTEAFSAYANQTGTKATPIKVVLHFILIVQVLPYATGGGTGSGSDFSGIVWGTNPYTNGRYDNECYDNSVADGTYISFQSDGTADDGTVTFFNYNKGQNVRTNSAAGPNATSMVSFPLAPINNIEAYLPQQKNLSAVGTVNNSYIYKGQYFLWSVTRPIIFYSDVNNFDYFPLIQTISLMDYPDEQIQVFQPFADSALIFTKYHIYRLDGSSIEDFQTHLVNSSVGALNSKCVQAIKNSVFFVSDRGAYELKRSYSSDNQLLVNPIDTKIANLYDPKNDTILTTSDGRKFYMHILNKRMTLIYNTDSQVWTKWSYDEGIQMRWVKAIKNDIYYVTDDWKICRFNDTSDYDQAQIVQDNDILRYQMLYIDKFDKDVLFNDNNEVNVYNGRGEINQEVKDCVHWATEFTNEQIATKTMPQALGWDLAKLREYGYGYPVVAKWATKEFSGYANQDHNLKKWKEVQIKFGKDSYASGGWYQFIVDGNIIINPYYYKAEDNEKGEREITVQTTDYLNKPRDKSVLTRNAGMVLSRSATLSSGDYVWTNEAGEQVTWPEVMTDENGDEWDATSENGVEYIPPWLSSTMSDTSEKNLRKKRGKKGYSAQTVFINDEPASFSIKSLILVYKLKKAK